MAWFHFVYHARVHNILTYLLTELLLKLLTTRNIFNRIKLYTNKKGNTLLLLLQVTEQDLIYTIQNALIEDSIKVYQLLGGSQGVSDELKLQLLQLLCFYNEKEPDSVEWLEERWFSANTRERQAATWR